MFNDTPVGAIISLGTCKLMNRYTGPNNFSSKRIIPKSHRYVFQLVEHDAFSYISTAIVLYYITSTHLSIYLRQGDHGVLSVSDHIRTTNPLLGRNIKLQKFWHIS